MIELKFVHVADLLEYGKRVARRSWNGSKWVVRDPDKKQLVLIDENGDYCTDCWTPDEDDLAALDWFYVKEG